MSFYICTSPGLSQASIPSRVRQASHNLIFVFAVAQSAHSFHNLGSLSQLSENLFLIVDCLNHCQLGHVFYIIYQKIQFVKKSEQRCRQPIALKCPQNVLRGSHPPRNSNSSADRSVMLPTSVQIRDSPLQVTVSQVSLC